MAWLSRDKARAGYVNTAAGMWKFCRIRKIRERLERNSTECGQAIVLKVL